MDNAEVFEALHKALSTARHIYWQNYLHGNTRLDIDGLFFRQFYCTCL